MKITKYICHRRPDRSFFYKNKQFPVCARCTGFYISGIISLILLKVYSIDYNYLSLIIGIIMFMPSIIDSFTQYMKLRESNNNLRLITGLLGGFGLVLIYVTLIYLIFGISY